MCVPASSKWIPPRQQHGSSGAAYRCDMEISKLHARRAQLIDVWRLIFLAAVVSQPVFSQVVEQNEHDIGACCFCEDSSAPTGQAARSVIVIVATSRFIGMISSESCNGIVKFLRQPVPGSQIAYCKSRSHRMSSSPVHIRVRVLAGWKP